MTSGQWTIVIQANNHDFAVMRKFSLTVAVADKTVVTVITWLPPPDSPCVDI